MLVEPERYAFIRIRDENDEGFGIMGSQCVDVLFTIEWRVLHMHSYEETCRRLYIHAFPHSLSRILFIVKT